MKSYVELSNELNKLETERRSLKDTKGKMVEEIEAIIRTHPEYPNLSKILPKNIKLIDSEHLEDRFNLLEEEISNLKISDEEKQIVANAREKVKDIETKIEELDNQMIALGPDLYNRKTYVIDRVLELQKIKTERETIEAELEIQNEELLKEKYNEIIFGRKKVIFNLEQKHKELLKKEDEIRKEENLYQDARLITEEKLKETKENEELVVVSDEEQNVNSNVEEQEVNTEVTNENVVNIDPTQYVSEEENEVKNVENNLSVEESQEKQPEETKEENNEQIESLVPEEPKKVKKVEKANLKLRLNALKKAGKIALGVGALALTVAFFIANPLLITQFIPQMLGEVGAAALAVSTIRERKK